MANQLAIPLLLLIIFLLALLSYRGQRTPALRSISAFDALPSQTGRAAESGQTLHLSLGTGGIGGNDTVSSLVGLSALAHLAEQGVATGTTPLVTISDPTLLPLAQKVLRQAYVRTGRGSDFRWTQVRLVSPSSTAYALGTMDILKHEPVLANVMFGSFGPEAALIARAGAETDLFQISGSDDPRALAVLYASTDRVVVGEELFATSVYLDRTPAKVASLAAEDIARVALIVFIVVVALARLAGTL
jgi:hypothetical protein